MICSMVKKGVLGAALGAGALYLVFGTSAPSYVRTAFHRVRHSAKDSIPVQFEIERAREEIANLEPAILENRETLARAEVQVERLKRQIEETQGNLAVEKREMLSLSESVRSGDFRLTGRRTGYSAEEVQGELARRLDSYRTVSKILEEEQATLKAREKAVVAAQQKLKNMETAKHNLKTKLAGIEAQLKLIEATQDKNEFNFDDSALARAKQTVAELEERLDVKMRVAEMEGRFSDAGRPIVEPGRDVLKEIDAEFGAPAKGTDGKSADKSL